MVALKHRFGRCFAKTMQLFRVTAHFDTNELFAKSFEGGTEHSSGVIMNTDERGEELEGLSPQKRQHNPTCQGPNCERLQVGAVSYVSLSAVSSCLHT